MSKARLVITAVVVEGRSQSEVARTCGISRPWVSRLVARYRTEGEVAFTPRSRRPARSPSATSPQVVELALRLRKQLVEQGLDAGHPQTCGRVERLHQTQKRWLRAQPDQPATIAALQVLLERFADEYNIRRPHRSLARRTPAAVYLARPKATPGGHDSPADVRVRRDRVDTSGVVTLRFHGRLHHIGIGRTHILLLVQDRDIRVVNATTGDLIRELVLDPSPDYQPLRNSPTQQETPNP